MAVTHPFENFRHNFANPFRSQNGWHAPEVAWQRAKHIPVFSTNSVYRNQQYRSDTQQMNTHTQHSHTLAHSHRHKYSHTSSPPTVTHPRRKLTHEFRAPNLFVSPLHVGVCLKLLSLTSESWKGRLKVERKKHFEVFLFQPRSTKVEGWNTHFQPSTFSFTLAFNFQLFLSTWSWKWSWKATSLM